MITNYPTSPSFNDAGEIISAVDWLGNIFFIGDLVMYCIGAGAGEMMAIGQVQAMEIKHGYGNNTNQPVQVKALRLKSSGRWDNGQKTAAGWVNEMNITAVPNIEQGIRNAINDISA